jgi:hypothetical protein
MNKDYIKTDDTTFAAFLMLHDYTALGAVDSGSTGQTGKPRYDIYLTHADPEIRDIIQEHSSDLRDLLNGDDYGYIRFFKHYRKLTSMMHNPIDKEKFL